MSHTQNWQNSRRWFGTAVIMLSTLFFVAFLSQASAAEDTYYISGNFVNEKATNTICDSVTEIPNIECEALVALYNSTDGNTWVNNSGWLQTNTPCTWHGISCNAGTIWGIDLKQNQLSGSIPPELGSLTNLKWLELYTNDLSGSIPPELGSLTNLHGLYLYSNDLSSSIPSVLGNLTNLEFLSLMNNQLSGNIPPELGNLTNLLGLSLYNNHLSGNIPPELGNLTDLKRLDLYNNQLSGSIPLSFVNLSELLYFNFVNTDLCELYDAEFQIWLASVPNVNSTGVICPSCDTITQIPKVECEALVTLYNSTGGDSWVNNSGWLQTYTPCDWYGISCNAGTVVDLFLSQNQLNGNIPPELGNLANLQTLDLGYNQLTSIPPEFGNLANLLTLDLSNNQLTSIPPAFGNLANLQSLDLNYNLQLMIIPPEFGNLTKLNYLNLAFTKINSFPPEFYNLNNLEKLVMHDGALTRIPPELGDLSSLQELILDISPLSGGIPPELGNLSNLKELGLSLTYLSGSIPPELGNLTNLQRISLTDTLLSGSIPLTFNNLTNLDRFSFDRTDLCEPDDPDFQAWLAGVETVISTGEICSHEVILVYDGQQFSDGYWYTGIDLADMDDDDEPEIFIGNRNTESVEIWQYDAGLDTLVQIDSIQFPYHIHDIKAADFDNDGDIDVVAGLRFDGLYYAMNTGLPGTVGSWDVREIEGSYTWQLLAEDFDDDGNLDILQGVDYGPIHMFYGDGMGDFVQGTSVEDPDTSMRFTRGFNAIDLNADGLLDLIGVDGAFMRAFLNPGDRVSAWASVGLDTPIGDYPTLRPHELQANVSPSAGDLDGNGIANQVAFLGTPETGWEEVEVLIFEGSVADSSWQWEKTVLDTIRYPGWAGHAGVADLDGDGNLDIHVGGFNKFYGLRAYLGDGKGNFKREFVPIDFGTGDFNTFAVGDINGDGSIDIVTGRYTTEQGNYAGFEVLFGQPSYSLMLPVVTHN